MKSTQSFHVKVKIAGFLCIETNDTKHESVETLKSPYSHVRHERKEQKVVRVYRSATSLGPREPCKHRVL